MDEVKQM
jgi:hypothetical protein